MLFKHFYKNISINFSKNIQTKKRKESLKIRLLFKFRINKIFGFAFFAYY